MDWMSRVIDFGVIGTLGLLSVLAFAIAIERKACYRAVRIEDYPSKKALELHLTRKLHIVATIASNAPYIGLLGTVLGIMMTFATMGSTGLADSGKIMSGLALALKTTAVGLLVAIPAVTLYNFLLRGVKERIMEWEIKYGREGV
jgi:biopolymer transport protein ExbB